MKPSSRSLLDPRWFIAVGANPRSAHAWRELIGGLLAAGRGELVLEAVRRGGSAVGWLILVDALLAKGRSWAALAAAREGALRVEIDAELWAALALLSGLAGRRAESSDALIEADACDQRHPLVWLARARAALADGDIVAGVHALETARTLGAARPFLELTESLAR